MAWSIQNNSNDPDVTVVKIYFPDDPQIQIHQSRIQMCLDLFPQGFYWFGKKKQGPGRPSKRVKEKLTQIHAMLDGSLINDDGHQTEIASNKTEAVSAKTTSTETKATE